MLFDCGLLSKKLRDPFLAPYPLILKKGCLGGLYLNQKLEPKHCIMREAERMIS